MDQKELQQRFLNFSRNFVGDVKEAWKAFMANFKHLQGYKAEIKSINRSVSRVELDTYLQNNVCEIVFLRRRPERAPNRPEFRRMLCTNSISLLASHNGKVSLNFRFPKTPRRLDQVKHNIVVVWDIVMQDYRNVSMDSCFLRQAIPANDTFWKYYNDVLLKMSPQDKMAFMDTV